MAYRCWGQKDTFKCRCGAIYQVEYRRFTQKKGRGQAVCDACRSLMAEWNSTIDRVYRLVAERKSRA